MLLIGLEAFKEIIDLHWFHLCIFACDQCDEKEGSAGIPEGGRSLKASPTRWLDLQIHLGISRAFTFRYLGTVSAVGTG